MDMRNPMTSLCRLVAVACMLSSALSAKADTLVHKAAAHIDALLEAHWKSQGVKRNEPISDEVFVRRIYLDLAGRIPTAGETVAFLQSSSAGKRAALIDTLLQQESYVSRFYEFWADILRYKSHFNNTANVIPAAWGKFIKDSLRANKPYDQFVREMLSAKGYAWENSAIGYYGRDPDMPLDNMAITTRIFLGTRIECAQCHDHPFDKWKQTEFYHLAAFTYGNRLEHEALTGVRDAFKAREQVILEDFTREKAASTDGGKAAEQRKRERLDAMEFRRVLNIIRHGVGQLLSPIAVNRKQDAVLKLPFDFHEPDGKPFEAMTPATFMGDAAKVDPGQDPAEVFARWVTSSRNPRFTRVVVNRLWKAMFGVALTEPLDDLRDDTTAMAPAVEKYLEELMVSLHYDMRALLAVIANTRAYQSSASHEEFSRDGGWHFQGPALRRMTAEQIWDSVVALANHEPDARDLAREARDERRIQVSHMVCDAYLNYDGKATVDLGYASLANEKAIQAKELAAREAEIEAKRKGDKALETELRREIGRLERERNAAYVRDFLMPLLMNLAQKKTGPNAKLTVDDTYKMNTNPALFAVETWRTMHVPGYGPAPKTPERLAAEAQAEKQRQLELAATLGIPEGERDGFAAYCQRIQREWLRASELESPAPRGHFLRTMGQSDRDFVENANPSASIPQALLLMNSEIITEKVLLSRYSPLMTFIKEAKTPEERVNAAYLAILSRKPTAAEKALLSSASADGATTNEDLIYALLNSKQFLFNQ